MESKALVKLTNSIVACRFFARTHSRILRIVNICKDRGSISSEAILVLPKNVVNFGLFGLVSLFNGISTLFRLFNAKAILLEEQ